jgi:hypothetical protein
MLTLVAAVEAVVARAELGLVSSQDAQYPAVLRALERGAGGRDVLFVGDSQAKMGVVPRVVAERSGLRAANLAIAGAQAPAVHDVLRRALRAGARPSAVVVDFHPLLLAMPPRVTGDGLSFLLGPGAALRLGWEARDSSLLGGLLARGALPSLRCREGLRSRVRWALEGVEDPQPPRTLEALDHWARNDGAWVMPAMADRSDAGVAGLHRAFPPGWTPDRVNVAYVRRVLRLAEASRAAVYWLIPPTRPVVQATNEASGFDVRYLAFVRAMQAEFPGLVVIDGRHAVYDPAVFLNPDHLGREGAIALSRDLGDLLPRLAREAPPGRWVPLPRYRAGATAPEVVAARVDGVLPGPAPAAAR